MSARFVLQSAQSEGDMLDRWVGGVVWKWAGAVSQPSVAHES